MPIHWLFRPGELPPNVLLGIDPETRSRVLSARSGQQRLNKLFRSVTHLRIGRNTVATVAQQDDYMKRVRSNGGSRSALAAEGIIICGGDYESHRSIAGARPASARAGRVCKHAQSCGRRRPILGHARRSKVASCRVGRPGHSRTRASVYKEVNRRPPRRRLADRSAVTVGSPSNKLPALRRTTRPCWFDENQHLGSIGR